MSEKILNTKFEYTYVDAANWKDHYAIVLDGVLSNKQIKKVLTLCEGEFFLPRAIGLPGGVLMDDPGYDPKYDHYWCSHDFEDSFSVVEEDPTEINARGTLVTISANEFVALFERCKDHSWESVLAEPLTVLDIREEHTATRGSAMENGKWTVENEGSFSARGEKHLNEKKPELDKVIGNASGEVKTGLKTELVRTELEK